MSGSFICMRNAAHPSMAKLPNTALRLKHSSSIRPILERFFHLHGYYGTSAKPSCQTLLIHRTNPQADLSSTCVMRHIRQCRVAKHSPSIEPVSRHDGGAAFTATPCNHSSFIEPILKEPLHLYMAHPAMPSFSNKALLSNQFQGMMKVPPRPERQCNHDCP